MNSRLRILFLTTALSLGACDDPRVAGDASSLDATSDIVVVDAASETAVDAPAARPVWLEPYTPSPRTQTPVGFLWGSATAAYQIEGGLDNTDWAEWERMGKIARNERANDGPRSYQFFADDVRTLSESRQNAYRFSIEWARIFPTREAWMACASAPEAMRAMACRTAASADGLQYYHRLLDALRMANIRPLVTLQHFTFPSYINDLRAADWRTQGWMREGIVQDLGVWAGFIAAEYGSKVDWWVTINEPLVTSVVGYIDGRTPPGRSLEIDAVLQVVRNMIRSHALMYDAIKRNDTAVANPMGGPITPAPSAMVSIAHHYRLMYGHDPNSARDRMAAERADYLFNRLFINAVVRGDLDNNGNGTMDAGEPMNDPTLRGRMDYFGINYYSLSTIRSNSLLPLVGGIPTSDELDRGLPKTDFGWDIYPRGFQQALEWAGTYGLPVVVTENGLADSSDANRARFLAEHVAAMQAAMQRGVRVLGYFHWSTIDNFEWVAGYCPHFGLYAVDFNDPMRRRTARPSAQLYQQIIAGNGVSDALLAAQMPYRSASTYCSQGPTGTTDGGR